jgi:DNA polymerase-3 subunit delta
MKLTGARLTSFLRSPDPKVLAVLIYGPDHGLIRERAQTLAAAVTGDPTDPFRNVDLEPSVLRSEPSRLLDEAAALSFSGGRRAVRVRDATDGLTKTLEDFLEDTTAEALVIVEARELTTRSSLRRLFENSGNGVAMACYADTENTLGELVDETLRGDGLTLSPEASGFLASNLGADRGITRSELEKLAVYMGGPGTVTLDDAAAAVGDCSGMSVDSVIYATFGGNPRALDRMLQKALAESVQPVAILRATARHLQRLHLASSLVAAGRTPDQAMQALKPPVFMMFKTRFRKQLRLWSGDRLAAAFDIVTQAELDCKTTGLPAEAICGRALFRLAQAAKSGAVGR